MSERVRCAWARTPAAIAYHDREWGTPVHDDRTFFEFLVLEGAQAGLSWETILRKRDGYRAAFALFDPVRVAKFGDADRARLLADASIVRNRAKIDSAIGNARALLALREATGGSFSDYLWAFAGGKPLVGAWNDANDVPVTSALARDLSRDLRARGFRFVGPTIVYSFLQATGLVDDHVAACFRAKARGQSGNARPKTSPRSAARR